MRRSFLLAACAAAAAAFAGGAWAQAYPARPIRLIVPFPAGGGNDAIARFVAEPLGKALGQPVVVDNKAGAGGNVGTDIAAKSAPDGYTLVHVANTVVMNPSLYKKLPFDVQKDFVPLGLVATSPILILANPNAPVRNLASLVERMKGGGADLSYGTPGVGTPHHFAMALMASRLNSKILHVAYKGASPAVVDAVGGQVPLLISTPQAINDFVATGKLRLLASMEPRRMPQFKDTPVVAEMVPGFTVSIWQGLLAPAGTPKAVVDKLSSALSRVMADPEVQKQIQGVGFQAVYEPPATMKKHIDEEILTWKKVAEEANISAE